MSRSQRFLELDALRGLAALAVVVYHYTTRFHELYGHSEKLWVKFSLGLYGVHLFFIISGFVIFMTLERTRAPWDFIVARFSRLYPAYWTALMLTFVVVSLAGLPGRQVSMSDALINLSMVQFWFRVPHVDPVYWTLSLELSFYAIMLILYCLRLLPHIESLAAGWLMMMILTAIAKRYLGLSVPDQMEVSLLLEYANLFIAGMMFYLMRKQGGSLKRWLLIACCLAAQWIASSQESTLIVGVFLVTFYLVVKGYLSLLACRPLIFLGTISYALYLIHQNIGYVIIRALYRQGMDPNVSVAIAMTLSLAMASAVTFLVEQPMLRAIRTGYAKFRQGQVTSASVVG